MLSRIHIIREFVGRELRGIADGTCIAVESNETADHAVVTLTIAGMKYGLSVKSSASVPPLGEIIFTDRQSGEAIRGEVRDHVWSEIAQHIRAAGKTAPAAPVEPAVLPLTPPAAQLPADGRMPFIGLPIVFTPNPSEARGGVTEMSAVVTKVHPDGTVGLTLLPYFGEPMWRDRVPRRRTDQDTACWDFLPGSDVAELVTALAELKELVTPSVAPVKKSKGA
jgi:hypothetical protein